MCKVIGVRKSYANGRAEVPAPIRVIGVIGGYFLGTGTAPDVGSVIDFCTLDRHLPDARFDDVKHHDATSDVLLEQSH